MMTVEDFERLTKSIDKRRERKAQMEGELKQMLKTLKEEFDCPDLDSAAKMLKELRQEAEELEKELKKELTELEEKYDLHV